MQNFITKFPFVFYHIRLTGEAASGTFLLPTFSYFHTVCVSGKVQFETKKTPEKLIPATGVFIQVTFYT